MSRDKKKDRIVSLLESVDEEKIKTLISIFSRTIDEYPELSKTKLYIIYNCKSTEEENIRSKLIEYSIKFDVKGLVKFEANLSLKEIKNIISSAKIGLNLSQDNFFEVSLIEMMVSGLVIIVFKNTYILNDIIKDNKECCYIATSESEYSKFINASLTYFNLPKHSNMRESARQIILDKFSRDQFQNKIHEHLYDMINSI